MNKLKIFSTLIILIISGHSYNYSQEVKTQNDTTVYIGKEVLVIASKYASVREDISASVYVIDKEEISNSIGNTVLELIDKRVAGLTLTQKTVLGYGVGSGAAGGINIRGVGGQPNTGVLVLVDGRPDIMGIFGHPISDVYSLENVEKIEVVKGPASVLYGTNAMGGIINIITKKDIKNGYKNSISGEFGSFNTYKTQFTNEGGFGKLNYLISLGINGTDGHREKSDYKSNTYTTKLIYNLSEEWEISLGGNSTKFKMHDPGTVTNPAPNSWFDVKRDWFDLSILNKTNFGSGEFKLHSNMGHHEIYDGWVSNDKTYGFLFYQHLKPFSGNTLTIGFDYKKIGGDAKDADTNYNYGKKYEYQYAPYFHIQQAFLKKIIVSTGIRIEKIYNRKSELVSKFGLVYHVNDKNSLKTNVSKGFRAPTIRELYFFPPSNTKIDPEELWNYEIGYNYETKKIRIEALGFIMEGSNLIRVTGNFPNVAFKNTGEFTHKGVELNAFLKLIDNVNMSAGYCWLDPQNETQYNPKNKINFNLSYSKDSFRCELFTQSLWDRFGSDFAQNRLDQFVIWDSRVSYDISKYITLIGKINNITNENYQIIAGYPMPGRNFSIGLRIWEK
jgi:iron complex outermembrane receptor protein